ncbi:MAG: 23S rRNA (adenine(2030)-N(6))-methyltransferase RlmJ [Treponema sp.]|nr:23S rRNA (adenine(2030)-N(6))-methyltransferase RlmJ [Treponema sp.]
MLSYQHVYHAGNHADILKHYVLTFVLNSLNKKEKPYTFFDTHSGSGLYDLTDSRSLKTSEAEAGITKLLKQENAPEELKNYLDFVRTYTEKGFYPGSPEIERAFMRQQDVLVLSELHPQEIENLKQNMNHTGTGMNANQEGAAKNPVVQIHKRDGWEMIKAMTPPETKRGGVLIDPSYEEDEDYENAAEAIIKVHKKWSSGIILLWYPLLEHREIEIKKMLDSITQAVHSVNVNTELENLQLCVNPKGSYRLYGSGMLVINAPWKLKEEGETVINYLGKIFGE